MGVYNNTAPYDHPSVGEKYNKTNDLEIVYESHEVIKIAFVYFSFGELYLDTVINDYSWWIL